MKIDWTAERIAAAEELLKEVSDYGGTRAANARERKMKSDKLRELGGEVDAKFPEVRTWYCGRTYDPDENK